MVVLSPQQRNILESAVKQARKVSEIGASNALKGLAVDNPEPFAHMNAEQKKLRNSLRSKGRLLGDSLNGQLPQTMKNLTYELAYETWHKMLFAKFLEANHLLMHPDGVAVTMEDCEELAHDEGFADKWDAAANYASKMLPAMFRPDDPLMLVVYSTDERIKLEEILGKLEDSTFTADDALGWVYQFWQSEAKAAINASGDKIDGARLPAVTQLFTEPYMVHFLIDNTLGAWWVSRNPGVKPPVKFEYLRLLDDGTPAAGNFEGWPNTTAAVTSLDPCMGSGHFVASLFPILASLRMQEEGLTKEEATDKVIAENLHGLELDARCTQIAAFNLALTVWKFCGHYKELPEMNLACSGIAPKGSAEDWVKLVGDIADASDKTRMENGMRVLYEHFQMAPELGSLLDPTIIKADAFTASFDQLQHVLKMALENEIDGEQVERGVMAAGIAKAGLLLSKKYILQITNVPYLSRGKQGDVLATYCEKHYSQGKGNLATVFLLKMLKSAPKAGIVANVTLQDWLFQPTNKNLRKLLLKDETWSILAKLGPKGFRTTMYDFNVILISFQHSKPTSKHLVVGTDVSDELSPELKEELIKRKEIQFVNQLDQVLNPDSRLIFEDKNNIQLLSNFSDSYWGLGSGDYNHYGRFNWEIQFPNNNYIYQLSTLPQTKYFGAREHILLWEQGKGTLSKEPGAYLRGLNIWGKKGIHISQTGNLHATIYQGECWDSNSAPIIPKDESHLTAIWCFCSSPQFAADVRKIDQALKVTNATLVKVPFDLKYWQEVAEEKYPNGLPKPYSDAPTQWLFHGHPIKTENPLQVALARILGYRWPAESDNEMELSEEARTLIEAIKPFDALTDDDGIFCIPSVNAEQAGVDRLRAYLQEVFAGEWDNQTISQLLTKENATAINLEDWLRKEFFIQHCKVFNNRPFIWHIWDGRNDGFSALVNYHQLDKDNLSKLIYTYLGDWIRMCEAKKKAEESGAEGLLIAALNLKVKLESILQGEAPYDIFVRWKPLEQQPIGWEPDLNDGVRLNIRPFMEAGVLRKNPNIRWGIDRGKNPPGSFWGEIRDNDKHLSLEAKLAARE